MTREIRIKNLVHAEDSPYKTQTVEIGNKNFTSPCKTIDTKRHVPGITINESVQGVNEVYRVFNSKSIEKALTTDREREINNEIIRSFRKHDIENSINICFVEFEGAKFPNDNEIEYLTNLSYVHSDITPLPLLPGISKNVTSENFESFNLFIKKIIDVIEVFNSKPILGIIPMSLPSIFFPQLLNTYIDNQITSFCVDFQGSTVGSSLTKIRSLLKILKKEKLSEESFTYTLNLGGGKLSKSKNVISAKDILSFGYGFDVLGGQHVRKKLKPEVISKILSTGNMFENSLRLFIKDDYGYHRALKKEEVRKIYPEDSNIPLETLEQLKIHKNLDKLFNQEQQGLEAHRLKTMIREEKKVTGYLDSKPYVEKRDIKILRSLKES